MPTQSRKRKVLSAIRRAWKMVLDRRLDGDDDSSSADEEEDQIMTLYFVLESKRYLIPRHRVLRPPSRIQYYLQDMPGSEFKLHFRLSRSFFLAVCALIADYPEFTSTPGKQQRMSVELHLLGLLKILGSADGEGCWADFLSVGGHTPEDVLAKRTIRALNSLKAKVITWPASQERREISERIKNVSMLPKCIGLIDGTLFPLLSRPQDHGEDYFSRKASYAINGLVICDDLCRIRYENIGWPGSSHDNRVWRNCKVALNQDTYFDDDQYLLGDSAYQSSRVMVPAFKTSQGGQLDIKETVFNKCLATIRIRVEHCIGMLKGRFPLLRRLRCAMRNKKQIKDSIELIRTCMILHNMAIADPIPPEWIEPEPAGEEEDDNEYDPLTYDGNMGTERREYLRDLVFNNRF